MTTARAHQAIDMLATERERLIAWLRGVPQTDWEKLSPDGTWKARDYIAHLASIDPLLVAIMRSFQRESGAGAASDAARRFSIDDWNEDQILERRERSMDELIGEMERSRPQLNEALAAFTDQQLDTTFYFGGDKSRSPRDIKIAEFLGALAYHDRWHMEDARRAIAGEAEQAFGDKAFDSMLAANHDL
jgi:hypothetical protein